VGAPLGEEGDDDDCEADDDFLTPANPAVEGFLEATRSVMVAGYCGSTFKGTGPDTVIPAVAHGLAVPPKTSLRSHGPRHSRSCPAPLGAVVSRGD